MPSIVKKFQFCSQYKSTFVPSVVKRSRVLEIQAYMVLELLMSIVLCPENFSFAGTKLRLTLSFILFNNFREESRNYTGNRHVRVVIVKVQIIQQ